MSFALSDVLTRIGALSGVAVEPCERSLLHAYIACLSIDDLCTAISMTLNDQTHIRLALRNRLLRLLRDPANIPIGENLGALVDATVAASDLNRNVRQAADALHSAIFAYLPLRQQHKLLDRWKDRGTRGAMARWLKASKECPSLFEASVALSYWRASGDVRAAKSLANQATVHELADILDELVSTCAEGWIISKAVVRVGGADGLTWEKIHENHPATYLYLCARTHRSVSDDDAFELACKCSDIDLKGNRGLAIWSIGQMRMFDVLDRINAVTEMLQQRDMAEMRARLSI
ncbi:hypothetical protein AfiDRAFT_1547 [Afipia sp. 1NLS2]|nr:hypothetical protein AfiDRAFT_1547 [Afipia sp. 1NLS2]